MAKVNSILDDVESPGEYDESGKYDVCYYGVGGVGKSSLLRTAKGRGLVLYTPQKEGVSGKMVLRKWRDRIKVKTITDFDDFYAYYKALRDENPNRPPEKRFDWVAFDTITGAVQLGVQKVLSRRSKQTRGKRIKLSGEEWGAVAQLIDDEVVQPYKSLPISTIWIGQEKDKRRKRHGKITMDVTPGVLNAIQPAVLFMGRVYVMEDEDGNPQRRMRIGSHDSVTAKYRAANIDLYVPQIIIKPHIDKLVRYLYSDAETDCPFEEAFESEEEKEEEEELEVAELKGQKAQDEDEDDDGDDDDDD